MADAELSLPDQNQRRLELESLRALLQPEDMVLDIGCANGVTTNDLAPGVARMVGVDVTTAMLRRARKGRAEFAAGDVRRLPFRSGSFDVVMSTRCLINLPDWAAQQAGLEEELRVTRPGGRLVLLEGLAEGRRGLDALRREMGLEPMPHVPYNRDLPDGPLMAFLQERGKVEMVRKFGLYDLISRVAHPLMVAPEGPSYDAPINAVAADLALELEGFNEISRLGLIVLRKPGD
jgi:ubiquinone/menaquinone biosynthesis C-methylase UbiE